MPLALARFPEAAASWGLQDRADRLGCRSPRARRGLIL